MAAKVPVPEEIMKKIWQENRDFIAEKRLYDVNFFTFIWKLINLYTSEKHIAQNQAVHSQSTMLAIELACKFLIDIYARSKDNQMLPMWMNHMFFVFKSSAPACVWLLEYFYRKINCVKNVLMSCPIDRTRRAFADLIRQVLSTLRDRECNSYSQQLEDLRREAKINCSEVKSWIVIFIEALLSLVKDARNPRYANSQYFLVFQYIAELGIEERQYLIGINFLSTLRDFILGAGSFSESKVEATKVNHKLLFMKGPVMKGMGPPNYTAAIRTLTAILRGAVFKSQLQSWAESPPPTCYTPNKYINLTKEADISLSNPVFIEKVLKECSDEETVNIFITHTTWCDSDRLLLFAQVIRDGLATAMNVGQAKVLLQSLAYLQDVEDSISQQRMDLTNTMLLNLISDNLQNKELARLMANWVTSRQKSNMKFKQWVSNNHSDVAGVLSQVPPAAPVNTSNR